MNTTVRRLNMVLAMFDDLEAHGVHSLPMWSWVVKKDQVTKLPTECGTVGCVLGTAASRPEFNAEGLKLDETGTPVYEGMNSWGWGWKAVSLFFGVSDSIAERLFSPESYRKPSVIDDDQTLNSVVPISEIRPRITEAIETYQEAEDPSLQPA